MAEFGAFEAKNKLSALLERAQHGEEIVITRRGRPIAKLVPYSGEAGRERGRAAAQRIRDRARSARRGDIVWEEWKQLRDEGRR
ncbi:MAG: type II toxin-antitoxin system prevent-host-death family antitoxin [Hyphomicrobiales bacterium]|nr:type II toxin-antitoxin system prevent-host-death family antitoxin [Hyphomicrobiales bacterium]